jgi:UDP-N-acetylglucosamine 2-epimerase (non-hydrolysing)
VFSAPVWIVIGTRPEAIKLAPVVHALEARGFSPRLVVTGQHPSLRLADYGLAGRTSLMLGCRGHLDPRLFARDVCEALEPHLQAAAPELLLVQGDTSSALGGALAGFVTGTPVGHVEAGLRTHDPAMPWPEEENRVAIDADADLLFAPTELSAANLRAERVQGEIHVTGNTAIDALAEIVGPLPLSRPLATADKQRLLVTCHRRENWQDAFEPIAAALIDLASDESRHIDVVLHPNPAQAQTMRAMLGGCQNISLVPPMDHRAMIEAVQASTLLLSDSGGIQEEAPALGVPLLILRDKTERPDGIASGNMALVGTRTADIVATSRRLLEHSAALAAMSRPALPYGDGHAALRIAEVVADWLGARREAGRRLIA